MESPNTSYYLLRWSDHISNYAEMFLTLREQEEFVDCSIACEDGIVGAHRLVLAGCSSYIRDLLKRSSNPHPIIFLLDVSRSTVLLLMEFIYRGQAHIPHSRLRQLVTLGKALKIKGLSQVFMPERCEPMDPQIPRLHGYPDPVCEVDVFDNRPNGGTNLNNSSQGDFISTSRPSEKDFPARNSTLKDMNHKGNSDYSQKENHNMSEINNHIDEDAVISDKCEDDSEECFVEKLVEESSKTISEMNRSLHSTDTVISEKVAVSQPSTSSEANYIPKPKSKQNIQEKPPKPSSESKENPLTPKSKQNIQEKPPKPSSESKEKLLTPKSKQNIPEKPPKPSSESKETPLTPTSKQNIEKSPKPKNKKNLEDSPSNATKKLKQNHSASPNKRNLENSGSEEDRRASPRVKKKKNSKQHQTVKPPAYKVKKIPLKARNKLYGRKQAKIELVAYALKNGFEASQRYASSKYGVKIRPKSLEKLVSMYSGLAKMKMKGLTNESVSYQKRPVGRPRKRPKRPPLSKGVPGGSGLDVDPLSSSIIENEMVASVIEGENVPSRGNEFHHSGRKSLQFNVAGLFAKSGKSESTGVE